MAIGPLARLSIALLRPRPGGGVLQPLPYTTTITLRHARPSTLPASLLPSLKHCVDASWPGFTDRSNAHKTAPLPRQHTMHEHTTKAVATFGTEAPLIKAIATLEAEETILTKTVAALEHVETLDMMRVTVVEKSNGTITLPDVEEKDHVPTTEGGDTLGRDGDRNKVLGNVCY